MVLFRRKKKSFDRYDGDGPLYMADRFRPLPQHSWYENIDS